MKEEGGASTLFNMGINGLFATGFVLAVGGDLNGPTIGGIFTIVGFSATGKHLRNIAPVMFGVYLASFTKNWEIYEPSPILALLLSTTLAPVAGEFGAVPGIIAGFLHSSVALNVGDRLWRNEFIQQWICRRNCGCFHGSGGSVYTGQESQGKRRYFAVGKS